MRILVVDDDPDLVQLLCTHLEQEGYEPVGATSGAEGLRLAYELRPELVLLDIRLPDLDGREICRRLRALGSVPIIILSALGDEVDKVRGFCAGADDYISKTAGMNELAARIRAVLRRASSGREYVPEPYDDGVLFIDPLRRVVERYGLRVDLVGNEYRLLFLLFTNRGRVVPRVELAEAIWGVADSRSDHYIAMNIRYLRQRLEDDPGEPTYIRTHRGVGYWFHGRGDGEPLVEGDQSTPG